MNISSETIVYIFNYFRYLERDISAENLVDIKQKVQDKYRYYNGGHQTKSTGIITFGRVHYKFTFMNNLMKRNSQVL